MSTSPSFPLVRDVLETPLSSWETTVSTSATPFLQDHAVQGSVVLPGASYVEMGLLAATTVCAPGVPLILQSIDFQNMLFLSSSAAHTLTCTISPKQGGTHAFTVSTSVMDDSLNGKPTSYSTALIVANEGQATAIAALDIDAIRTRADSYLSGSEFYLRLHENGNEYGSAFQAVHELWIGRGEVLARVSPPASAARAPAGTDTRIPHPVLMDACVQTLAALNLQSKRTYVLSGFEEILTLPAGHLPAGQSLQWIHATISDHDSNGDEIIGSMQLLDANGTCLARLTDARLRYLGQEAAQEATPESTTASVPKAAEETITIAATFTAEPIEDSLTFWCQELAFPTDVAFAPYNQLFQQLLDPNSLLLQNKRGVNVILLRPEDWSRYRRAAAGADALTTLDEEKRKSLLQDQRTHTLPDQREIAHLNAYETAYVYQEIFVDRAYMKHGIEINDGDCILDIGANIGLFSLFALDQANDIQIYAFEPSPPANRALRTNMAIYGENVQVFDFGIADKRTAADFTFYENSSVFSSFHADHEDDAAAIRAVVENMVQEAAAAGGTSAEMQADVDVLMQDRLASQTFVCQLRAISDVIQEQQIARIDLLKLDAEKSELAALTGIRDEDWPKIHQIVMEVHDREGSVLQAICELLRSKGFELAIEEETFLQRSGLFNIFATRSSMAASAPDTVRETDAQQRIRADVDSFVHALQTASSQMSVPCIVCLCPPSPARTDELTNNEGERDFLANIEASLVARLAEMNAVHVVKTDEIHRLYPTETVCDSQSNALGHVPYTVEFFTALGTVVMRKYHALRRAPYKVIVLDCDQTLWQGIVGEDGPHGIRLEAPYRQLQELMVQQQQAGMLLCLCSKNSAADVDAVFAQRTDMPLRAEHIVAQRINWQPKSRNIQALAAELQLGLNSFIFLDDNPIECAEVRANCPEVLTLQLPQLADDIPRFLQHVWAFDHLNVTAEDRNRTQLYHENIQRTQFRKQALSLSDFLAGLELTTRIDTMRPHQIERVSQLTQRTNQFNFTTRRRSPTDIEQAQRTGALACLVVDVSDRFGDYGLVGVVLFRAADNHLQVDTLLLSCRVLGRGVEHRILARLGEIAQERALSHVWIEYIPTQKNEPAIDFLQKTVAPFAEEQSDRILFRVPAATAASITIDSTTEADGLDDTDISAPVQQKTAQVSGAADLALFELIANQRSSVGQIMQQVTRRKVKPRATPRADYVAPRDAHEQIITDIWKEVLQLDSIGTTDNFKEIGGTSLKAVQLVAQMRKKLNIDMSLIDLFDTPTIGAIAARLQGAGQNTTAQHAQEARARAENRQARRAARRGRRR